MNISHFFIKNKQKNNDSFMTIQNRIKFSQLTKFSKHSRLTSSTGKK